MCYTGDRVFTCLHIDPDEIIKKMNETSGQYTSSSPCKKKHFITILTYEREEFLGSSHQNLVGWIVYYTNIKEASQIYTFSFYVSHCHDKKLDILYDMIIKSRMLNPTIVYPSFIRNDLNACPERISTLGGIIFIPIMVKVDESSDEHYYMYVAIPVTNANKVLNIIDVACDMILEGQDFTISSLATFKYI